MRRQRYEEIDIHAKCKECDNFEKPKAVKLTVSNSPCYQCIFNTIMVKTNNFVKKKVVRLV